MRLIFLSSAQKDNKVLFLSVAGHVKQCIEAVVVETKLFSAENSVLEITKHMHKI